MRSRIVAAGVMAMCSIALEAAPAVAQTNGQNGQYQNGQVDWNGAYSGLSLGGAGLGSDGGAGVPGFTTHASDRSSSLIGGVLAGINFGGSGFVFGLEGDFSFLNARTDGRFDNPFMYDADNSVVQARWLATVRPRVGLAMGRYLVYVTGGLALADVKVKETMGVPSRTVVSEMTPGWVLGGGVEYRLTGNMALRAEYLHAEMNEVKGTVSDSGAGPSGLTSYTHRAEPTFNIGRAALSFRF
jgi:outer membrane immunogenic protein